MRKPLTQMVPDFREALEEGVEKATTTIVRQLQEEGPYWSGFFSSMWQVNAGVKAIPANIMSQDPIPKNPPTERDYVSVYVPESPNLQGYTIGNRAEYRLYAMDIKTNPEMGRGKPGARITAPKKWYDRYINAEMPNTIEVTLTDVFRRFK